MAEEPDCLRSPTHFPASSFRNCVACFGELVKPTILPDTQFPMLWRILVGPSSMAGAGAEFQVLVAAGLAELTAARIGKVYVPFIVSYALLVLLKLCAGISSRLCELNLRVASNERSLLGCALSPLYQLPAFLCSLHKPRPHKVVSW